MAGAIIIASAIGVLLLVLCGYVLVSGTLASADSIGSAQKDMAQEKDEQVHTAIQISNYQADRDNREPDWHNLSFDLRNTGSEPIGDFYHTDMFFACAPTNEYTYTPFRYSFNGVVSGNTPGVNESRTWGYLTITPDTIHPYMLDPGETMTVRVDTFLFRPGGNPAAHDCYINVTTPNGATAGYRGYT